MSGDKRVEQIYKELSEIKDKYGIYHKTVFHVHTPASYDYTLMRDWGHERYLNADINELSNICVERGVIPQREILDECDLEGIRGIYESRKEWLSYLILANELIVNDFEIVVVTDHNSIGGIEKLKLAVDDIHKYKNAHTFPEIICGVEISCADKLHIVGMFDINHTQRIRDWLDNNLINEKDGTFQTSLSVMDFIKNELLGIAYIAHINTSDLFSGEKYLSGGYKKRLKTEGCFEYIGVKTSNQIENINMLLERHHIKTRGFVIDNDAHNIQDINQNYFWIKSGKRSFKTLKEAFDDFEISVSLTKITKDRMYIRGILIEEGGFLKGKNEKNLKVSLSDSLNCFIGGRGAGKSTILQMIDYALGQRVEDEQMLEFICNHGDVWILFVDGQKEYIIRMAMPIREHLDENILRCFGQNEADRYRYKYYFSKKDVATYALRNYLSIYEIVKGKDKNIIEIKTAPKSNTLYHIYDTRYSVNELVQKAGSGQIDDFIRNMMFQNKKLSSPENIIKCKSKNGLNQAIGNMEFLLNKRKREVEEITTPFNKKMTGTLRIVYKQDNPIEEPDFEKWIFPKGAKKQGNFMGIDMSEENVVEYLYYVCRNAKGPINLLKMALGKIDKYQYDIKDFFNEGSRPSAEEKREAINKIFDELITEKNYNEIIAYLRKMVADSESLSLEFNVNSRTTTVEKEKYVDVRKLSLGQKVVAMLDFIFGYGDYVNDNRPILIDQPEDNLDSTYIYLNLVQQLRSIKDRRQIIIATHNATIVTNAMADQVCVMCSDGNNGWIEKVGYPSEDSIKKEIVNYLEGGRDSFRHKMRVYKPVL